MKTRLFTFLVFLFLGSFLYAEHVPVNIAEQVAKNFIYEKTGTEQTQIVFEEPLSIKESNEIVYYVFNKYKEGGFVIISAEDTYYPIIGYSLKNTFKTENQPENVSFWMQQYKDQIIYLKDNKIEANDQISLLWNKYRTDFSSFNSLKEKNPKAVDPLTDHILWDQSGGSSQGYYDGWDKFTPEGTPTGCVATAMTIIMYYWKYPVQGDGSHSYYHPSYGVLGADFGETTYMWANMLDADPTYYSALLQYHAGVSVDMYYSPNGSGTQSSKVPGAMQAYFRYNTSTLKYKTSYTTSDWKNLLKNDLNNGLPVYYSGRDDDNGGHAFVCDGYDDSDNFHFNFGWGGYQNGYYTVNDVGGFHNDQAVITEIEPAESYYPYSDSVTNLTAVHDLSNTTHFEVDLEWDAPTKKDGKALSGFYVYRGDELIADNLNQYVTQYTDDELTEGIADYYAVRAIYDNGTSLCVSRYVDGKFDITFRVYDTQGGSGLHQAEVTFNGETQNTGFGSVTFSDVPFGGPYDWIASYPGYTDQTGTIDLVNQNDSYYIYMDGSSINEKSSNIVIYPNPTDDYLYVEGLKDVFNIAIYDINGKKVYSKKAVTNNTKLDLSDLSSGVYMLKINIDNNFITQKILLK